jgi:hypothetical protein
MKQQQIETWLRQLGCAPTGAKAGEVNEWTYQFVFPPGSQQNMAVFAPRTPAGSTVISVNYPLGQGEAAFDGLSDLKKAAFLQELQLTLSRDHLYHDLARGSTATASPRSFAVFDMRFDDGLTLDSFARSIISVSNAALAANVCCARHLFPAPAMPASTPDGTKVQ